MPAFTALAVSSLDEFVFGRAPRPVRTPGGLEIGGGTVYPELNFTLPAMTITADTMPEVRAQYSQMIEEACERAARLKAPGLVVEFELLPPLTQVPEWGAEVTAILREGLDRWAQKEGLKGDLRVTPNDIREFDRPPRMRDGLHWDNMVRSFELCAGAGGTLLAIESTGGKELHDDALLYGDLRTAVLSLGVLGARDMAYLWDMIVGVAGRHGIIASGDTACGFANTAMVLAETGFIPRVWAAVNRVMTVPRSLVAYERGAVGPSKDCAYEGPFMKAITGCPVSMEGAEAACAHLSPVGNISKAVADLWSNESVQNVRLLGAMAPTVSLEQLVYATRLMNTASHAGHGAACTLRDCFVESDATLDPQAYVLRPDVVLRLSAAIIEEATPYLRTRRAAIEACAVLREAADAGTLTLSRKESSWLDRLRRQAETLPDTEEAFLADMLPGVPTDKIRLEQYGLDVPALA